MGGSRFEDSNSSFWYPTVSDFSAYNAALKAAGLHPSDKDAAGNLVLLDHSRVQVSDHGGDSNVASNGMYDFIFAYYNPAANADTAGNKAMLPQFYAANLAFDGYAQNTDGTYLMTGGKYTPALPTGATSRSIGGTVCANTNRKGPASGNGITGMPNEDFIGSVTVPMANYLRSIGVTEFKNTNIIGDGSLWNGISDNNLV